MKTYEIKDLLKRDLLVVELPDGWIFNTYKDQIGFCNELNIPMQQIKGSYTLLGKADEIREDDAKELVESWESVASDGTTVYQNYHTKIPKKRTATESLLSAIESVIFWGNPIKLIHPLAYMESPKMYHKDAREYKEAELRTFDRNRSIILVKN